MIGLFLIGGNKVGVSGSVYFGDKLRTYVAVYRHFQDVYIATPSHEVETKRIAHISYGFENFRRGIDVFQVNRDDIVSISNKWNFKKTISLDKKEGFIYDLLLTLLKLN